MSIHQRPVFSTSQICRSFDVSLRSLDITCFCLDSKLLTPRSSHLLRPPNKCCLTVSPWLVLNCSPLSYPSGLRRFQSSAVASVSTQRSCSAGCLAAPKLDTSAVSECCLKGRRDERKTLLVPSRRACSQSVKFNYPPCTREEVQTDATSEQACTSSKQSTVARKRDCRLWGQRRVCAGVRGFARVCASMRRVCAGMRGYARVCAGVRGYARVCASMREYVRVCAGMREHARVCASMRGYMRGHARVLRGYARVCASMCGYARVCASMRPDCAGMFGYVRA